MLTRLGVRTKLILASVVLMLVAGIVIERFGTRELEALMLERVRADLNAELGLIEGAVITAGESVERPVPWDAVADRLGSLAGMRVTLIDPAGKVVGDSSVAADDLDAIENHAAREEIAWAREHGSGTSIRPSTTVGERLLYAAARHAKPEQGVGTVRIAVPIMGIDKAVAKARLFFLVGCGFAIAAAVGMAAFGAHLLTRPARELTEAALAMSAGDLSARAPAYAKDELGKLGGALNRLASELSRSIAELRMGRDRLAGILEGMNEGVLVLDADNRIVLANRALRGMTLVGEDSLGKSVIEAIRNAALQEALDAALESSEAAVREIELGGILPRRLLVRVSRLSSDSAERGTIAVFHDVTDLRRLETIRTDFVANVSHELRTPVTAIGTAAETLLSGALDDPHDAREFVDIIERNAKRLRHLVDDLLDLARLESKDFRLKLAELDVVPIVAHTVRLLEEAARRRSVSIVVSQPDSPLKARIDRRALEQIVMNLLDNAIKYAGEGARITISSSHGGQHVEIRVSDDGPGIPPAHLGRIFERFYRVDAGRSRELGGTGLGLSIVKHLVELMNGTVEVESTQGKGASFTIRLPAEV